MITVRYHAIHIERKFAEEILEGRKLWEFRKECFQLYTPYLLCLSDEANRVIGGVEFSHVVGAPAFNILDTIEHGRFKHYAKRICVPRKWIESYAKPTDTVFAHLVLAVARFELPPAAEYKHRRVSYPVDTTETADRLTKAINDKHSAARVDRFDLLSVRKPL